MGVVFGTSMHPIELVRVAGVAMRGVGFTRTPILTPWVTRNPKSLHPLGLTSPIFAKPRDLGKDSSPGGTCEEGCMDPCSPFDPDGNLPVNGHDSMSHAASLYLPDWSECND